MKVPAILFVALFSVHVSAQNRTDSNTLFPKGNKGSIEYFTGNVWVNVLAPADSIFNTQIGSVTFEAGARTHWHRHGGGQTLLALNGMGYYQEKGKPLQILRQGDVVRCPPDVEHWHGASYDNWFVQLALTPEHPKGRVNWLHEVGEAEYQAGIAKQQEAQSSRQELEKRHQHIVAISAFTTKGDLEQLKIALTAALDAKLTVNEIKEVLTPLRLLRLPPQYPGAEHFDGSFRHQKGAGNHR